VRERETRKDAVMGWASVNWEKLEKRIKEDEKDQELLRPVSTRWNEQELMHQQLSAQQAAAMSGLGSLYAGRGVLTGILHGL
jgi:hypothetical protein